METPTEKIRKEVKPWGEPRKVAPDLWMTRDQEAEYSTRAAEALAREMSINERIAKTKEEMKRARINYLKQALSILMRMELDEGRAIQLYNDLKKQTSLFPSLQMIIRDIQVDEYKHKNKLAEIQTDLRRELEKLKRG